jgi:hypothetical protein
MSVTELPVASKGHSGLSIQSYPSLPLRYWSGLQPYLRRVSFCIDGAVRLYGPKINLDPTAGRFNAYNRIANASPSALRYATNAGSALITTLTRKIPPIAARKCWPSER